MGILDEIGAGAGEIIFGKDPNVEVEQHGTLTPEQEEMLRQLIAGGAQTPGDIQGVGVSAFGEEGLSMEDLAALRSKISEGQAAQIFGAVGERARDPESRREFFGEAVKPLQEEAQESLRSVGREFSGSGFFSSERQAQDENVQEAFADAQGQLMAKLIREDEDRALSAASGITNLYAAESNIAMTQLQTQLQAAIASGDNEMKARIQNSMNQLQSQQLYQQLLGVQGVENVVLNEAGTSGIGGTIIGAAAGTLLGSDQRLKYNIHNVLLLPIGVWLVNWQWKHSGRSGFGVIAQDLKKVLPEAVVKVNGIFMVNYKKVIQAVSNFRTQGDK